MAKAAGRPKKTEGIELISLEECMKRMQEEFKLDKPPFARGTLLNKFHSGDLTRYGTYHCPLVDWKEAKKLVQWRRKVS